MPKIRIDEAVKSVSITHKFNKSDLIFLNTSDILNGEILTSKYMKVEDLKGQAKKTIRNGDVLFSEIRPKNRRFAFVDVNNPDDYVVSTKLMVLRNNNPRVIQRYFYYFVTSEKLLSYLQMRAESRIGSFPQITFDLMAPLTFNLPSLEEQKIVIHKLDTFDSTIKNNNQLIESLEKYIQLLFHKWFVDFNFPNENGEPYKDSGGEMVEVDGKLIPKGWKFGEFKHLATIKSGFPFQSDEYDSRGTYGIITIKNVQDGEVDNHTDSKINKKPNNMPQYCSLQLKDILISLTGNVGRVGLVTSIYLLLNQRVGKVILKSDIYHTYVYTLLRTENFKKVAVNLSNGTSQKNLSPLAIERNISLIPSNNCLIKFNSYDVLIDKIVSLRQQNESLIVMRDLLINKLIK